DDWSVCDWCDQCHRKGGLVVWVDAFEPAGGLVGGEALVAAVLGKIDAVEVSPEPRKTPLLPWVYRLWDAGFRVPLVGASGKHRSPDPGGSPPGARPVVRSRTRRRSRSGCRWASLWPPRRWRSWSGRRASGSRSPAGSRTRSGNRRSSTAATRRWPDWGPA